MHKMPEHGRPGFTLLEVSIVLVIIGLIIGGILIGRVLIHSAEIRAVVSQREKYNTAVNTFRIKYGCLPGDCVNGLQLALGPAQTTNDNGNGDGQIGVASGFSCGAQCYREMTNFWYQLSSAGLIPDTVARDLPGNDEPGVQSPLLKMTAVSNGSGWSGRDRQAGWWILSAAMIPTAYYWTWNPFSGSHYFWITAEVLADTSGAAALIPSDAYAIDAKTDDGLPFSGTVLAADDYSTDALGPAMAGHELNTDCIISTVTPNQYNVTSTTNDYTTLCSLLLRATF